MITGTDQLIKDLLAFGSETEVFVKAITEATGRDIEADAKVNAASIQGAPPDLKQKIAYKKTDSGLSAEVTQNLLPLGAFTEFGTGTYVVVADEWKDMAWQFYVNGKGRMTAAPYMYPAYVKGRQNYLETLEKKLDKLTDQYNGKS